MKNKMLSKIQLIVYVAAVGAILSLLIFLGSRENVEIREKRKETGFVQVEDVQKTEVKDSDAPLGVVTEYRFLLDMPMEHDMSMAFYTSHQYADIYLGEEHVYSLVPSDEVSIIRTTGPVWMMVPLYKEDAGKEVRVVLTPVYESYMNKNISFMVGSSLAIYKEQLWRSLPELLLALLNIVAGVLYLGLAFWRTRKNQNGKNFAALGMLAICAGCWRVADTKFSPFLLEVRPAFLFYVSVTAMMCVGISLIKSIRDNEHDRYGAVRGVCCTGMAVIVLAQIGLQWLGIRDLREMFTVTHTLLGIGGFFVVGDMISSHIRARNHKEEKDFAWVIASGVLANLVLFYLRGTSSGLLMLLLSVLLYVFMEGNRIWKEQERLLEEKEKQITQSRITTLMGQIRSHFVFNILNAISGMCKYDPKKADETVVRFARYLRNNINIMEDDGLITFRSALRNLEDYVMLEQVRFGDDRIQFETDITVDHFVVPPLIMQPIVENSIKHGLTPKPSGGTITLRTRETDRSIQIILEDDGVGFHMQELEKSQSVGVRNIRFRLYHTLGGTLDIRSEVGCGTISTITIPKEGMQLCE